MTDFIAIDRIKIDGGTQPRAQMDFIAIGEYAEAMREGAEFPPITVFYDGENYWLADGFHRLAGAKETGVETVAAEVRQGTLREAILYSTGANAAHGLRRSNDDKRRAVLRLLEDSEWAQWSDREIARRTATSAPFVASLRPTVNIYSGEMRRGGDGRVMNTANIGAKPAPKATFESAFPAAMPEALLKPVAEMEGDTPLVDMVMALPEEDKDIAINDPDVYAAMGRELVAAGLAEDDDAGKEMEELSIGNGQLATDKLMYNSGGTDYSALRGDEADEDDDDAGEDPEEDLSDEDGEESEEIVPGESAEIVRAEVAAAFPALPAAPPPPPVAPAPPPLPAPVVRGAPWVLSISVLQDAPPLITVLHGAVPCNTIPAEVAGRVIEALRGRIEMAQAIEAEWLAVN